MFEYEGIKYNEPIVKSVANYTITQYNNKNS